MLLKSLHLGLAYNMLKDDEFAGLAECLENFKCLSHLKLDLR